MTDNTTEKVNKPAVENAKAQAEHIATHTRLGKVVILAHGDRKSLCRLADGRTRELTNTMLS